jgi:hypothetical protein
MSTIIEERRLGLGMAMRVLETAHLAPVISRCEVRV